MVFLSTAKIPTIQVSPSKGRRITVPLMAVLHEYIGLMLNND